MPPGTAEASGQKNLDQLQGERRPDHLCTETKDVHVIVFDALTGRKDIMDEFGTHAGNLVRSDGGSNAATAERYAALDFACGDGPDQGNHEVRIVIFGIEFERGQSPRRRSPCDVRTSASSPFKENPPWSAAIPMRITVFPRSVGSS